ncbi:PLP-dependent aminotransferase family protein [Absiella sp. AM29-15]|uniref:MocR-like pyridoxine biosynthesis transcription factor PdxR n=1 Tax=Absiella sp. AM29-15 TaxID=2292278 RepID=UPI000E411C89|nr:PLP-dependent aminotransferase family protein [Absiella sp. AM29-15]RGC50892.1 PLP-dependent aminotransferase family protein [Absiella sp. AM29-15]
MKINTINFEKQNGRPIYLQLYEKLRDDMLAGYLKKNDQLPSIRKCEKQLKISKTSVERAYEQLLMEGYIVSIPQKGYFVDVDEEHCMLRKQLVERPYEVNTQKVRYDFRSQTMDKDAFDMSLWKKYLKEVLDMEQDITTYGDAQGEYALRLALGRYAYSMRGVFSTPERMLIGASFQSLLYILCGYLKEPIIGMEESGFLQAEQVFSDYGYPVIKLDMHPEGVSIEELIEKHINVLYINAGSMGSDHQPLQSKKRKELLAWAKAYHALIIEDDHNGELRYHSRPTPCMQGYDMGKHVLYIGSFSKLLLPALRISYLVMNQEMFEVYEKDHYGPSASKIEQLALARYISDGHLERHVKRLKKRYEYKCHYMMELLHRYLPDVDVYLEEAGLQLILRFPFSIDGKALIEACKKQQILCNMNAQKDLVLSFAGIHEEEMEEAVQTIVSIWKQVDKRI